MLCRGNLIKYYSLLHTTSNADIALNRILQNLKFLQRSAHNYILIWKIFNNKYISPTYLYEIYDKP